ncbi:hypothetical protein SDJN02_15353, partial [Cucurbita argyrosperma subsp. argyrosperma]
MKWTLLRNLSLRARNHPSSLFSYLQAQCLSSMLGFIPSQVSIQALLVRQRFAVEGRFCKCSRSEFAAGSEERRQAHVVREMLEIYHFFG